MLHIHETAVSVSLLEVGPGFGQNMGVDVDFRDGKEGVGIGELMNYELLN